MNCDEHLRVLQHMLERSDGQPGSESRFVDFCRRYLTKADEMTICTSCHARADGDRANGPCRCAEDGGFVFRARTARWVINRAKGSGIDVPARYTDGFVLFLDGRLLELAQRR